MCMQGKIWRVFRTYKFGVGKVIVDGHAHFSKSAVLSKVRYQIVATLRLNYDNYFASINVISKYRATKLSVFSACRNTLGKTPTKESKNFFGPKNNI